MNERIRAYRDTLLLTLIALPLGLAIGAMDALFGRVLLSVTAFRMAHVYSLLPFLGLVGVGIVWGYQKVGGTSGKGMTLLFEAGHGDTQDIPLRLIPLVMVSTWLTHLFGGSAGREGVAVQIGGTLAHSIGKRLPIPDAGKQLLLTGMAAGFAGLFRTPIAATFFALEVLTAGVLEYSALLPALVASFSASACSGLLGLEKFTVALTDQVAFSALLVGKLLLFGLVFGMAGGLFAFVLHKLKALFAQYLPNPLLRIFLFGVLVSGFSLLCWEGRYSPMWPDGKKHSRNVYGHTEAECEEKLAELILQMKAEIAALRSGASTEYPDGVSPKKKAITAYLRKHPGVTNKAKIARDLNMDRTTVQRYYDEIRAELRGEESPVPQM